MRAAALSLCSVVFADICVDSVVVVVSVSVAMVVVFVSEVILGISACSFRNFGADSFLVCCAGDATASAVGSCVFSGEAVSSVLALFGLGFVRAVCMGVAACW